MPEYHQIKMMKTDTGNLTTTTDIDQTGTNVEPVPKCSIFTSTPSGNGLDVRSRILLDLSVGYRQSLQETT